MNSTVKETFGRLKDSKVGVLTGLYGGYEKEKEMISEANGVERRFDDSLIDHFLHMAT